jgi:hypothetical protein
MALYEDNFDIFFINEFPKKQVIDENLDLSKANLNQFYNDLKTQKKLIENAKKQKQVLTSNNSNQTANEAKITANQTAITAAEQEIASIKEQMNTYKKRKIHDYYIYDNAFDKKGKDLLVEGKDRSLIITKNIDLDLKDLEEIFGKSLVETKIKEIAIAKVKDIDLYLICIHNDSNVTNGEVQKILDIINSNDTVKEKYILGLDANTKNIMDYDQGLENGIDISGLQFAPIINNVNNANNTKGYTPYTTNKVRTLAQSQWSKYEVDKSIKDLIIVPTKTLEGSTNLKINSSNVLRISNSLVSDSGVYQTYQCNTSACNELIPDNHHVFDHFISTANVKYDTDNHNVLLLNYSALQESPYEYETDDLKFFSQKIKAIAESTIVNKTYSTIRKYIDELKVNNELDNINLENLYSESGVYEFEHNEKEFKIPSNLSVFDFCSALNLKTPIPMENQINKENIQNHLKNPETATTESRIFSGFNQHAKNVCELIDPLEDTQLFNTFTQTGDDLLTTLTNTIINSSEYNDAIIKNKDLNNKEKYYIFRPNESKTASVNVSENASVNASVNAPVTEPVNILNYVIFYIIYCSIIIEAFNSCSPEERDIIIDAKNKINYVKPEKKAEALKNLFTKKFYIDTSTIEQQIINKQKQLENRIDTLFDLDVINKPLRDQKVRENLNPGVLNYFKRKWIHGYQQGVGTEVHINNTDSDNIYRLINSNQDKNVKFFLLRTYPFNTPGFRNLINIRSNKIMRQRLLSLAVTNEYGCDFTFKKAVKEEFNTWARNTGLTYEEFNKILALINTQQTVSDDSISNYGSELLKFKIETKGDKSKLHNFDEKTMINFNKCNPPSKAESAVSNTKPPYKTGMKTCKDLTFFKKTCIKDIGNKNFYKSRRYGNIYHIAPEIQGPETSTNEELRNMQQDRNEYNATQALLNDTQGGSKSKKRSKTRTNNRKVSRRINRKLSRTNNRKLSRRINKKLSRRNNKKISRRNNRKVSRRN